MTQNIVDHIASSKKKLSEAIEAKNEKLIVEESAALGLRILKMGNAAESIEYFELAEANAKSLGEDLLLAKNIGNRICFVEFFISLIN